MVDGHSMRTPASGSPRGGVGGRGGEFDLVEEKTLTVLPVEVVQADVDGGNVVGGANPCDSSSVSGPPSAGQQSNEAYPNRTKRAGPGY
jgi:hypothetical protein